MEIKTIKTYACLECCYIAKKACTLKRHIRSHHITEEKNKPFHCSECNYAFEYESGLTAHQKTNKHKYNVLLSTTGDMPVSTVRIKRKQNKPKSI
jgi:transposase-like protein